MQLVNRILQGLDRKLTLISAPAGFGKTSLLADCVGKIKEPVGWISLDENDNDPGRFLANFLACLNFIGIETNAEQMVAPQ